MVMTASSFGNIEAPTPHGGPPFQGWRNGFGFGKAGGPGEYNMQANFPMKGRYTPNGDRCYASSAFWKKRHEIGQANSFGIGDRPDYGAQQKGWSISPDNYGDISKQVKKIQRSVDREGITMKARYPTMDEKYRRRQDGKSGPGPCKYDVSRPPGYGRPAYFCGAKAMTDPVARMQGMQPGPGEYTTAVKPGKNSSISHGTLYDINMTGRPKTKEPGHLGPGPAKYTVPGCFDGYTLGAQIDAVKGPPKNYWRDPDFQDSPLPGSSPLGHSASSASLTGTKEDGRRGMLASLTRVESAPV